MKRRRTTAAEDAAFLGRLLADQRRQWKIGDECLGSCAPGKYGRVPTTIAAIDGDIATLADGSALHVSKLRSLDTGAGL